MIETLSEWTVAAFHVILTTQKHFQGEKSNKGKSVYVFDGAQERNELPGIVRHPPPASDGFYKRKKEQHPLDQLIDMPYFADSRHVGLLQIAEVFAFLIRLHAGLQSGLTEEKSTGATDRLAGWLQQMAPVLLPDSARCPKTSGDPCVRLLRAVAPPSLLEVTAWPPATSSTS